MGLVRGLRSNFITGLILILPLVITLYALWVLVRIALSIIDPIVQATDLSAYTANVEAVAQVTAVVLIVSTIVVLGYLAQRPLFRRLFGEMGRAVTIIPLFRTIYGTIRQLSTSLTTQESSYEKLVMVEYPREGVYSIGLVTDESPRPIEDVAGSPTHSIYLPSSPNPTSGRLVLVPDDQVFEVDMSVRQGMRMLMTTGIGGNDRPLPVDEMPDVAAEELSGARGETGIEEQSSDEKEDEDRSIEQTDGGDPKR